MPIWGKILLGILLAGVLALAGTLGYLLIRERGVARSVTEGMEYDAIIVLGAQVKADGQPSVQLEWRLDAAQEAYEIRPVRIVVCGAQGSDEPEPEAIVMKRYLMEAGIPEEQIWTDPDSFNTKQNLENAAKLLKGLEGIERVLIVTSDYHVPRAMALAEDLGFKALGLGSPVKSEYWLKNHARETLAWIKYWGVRYLHLPLE